MTGPRFISTMNEWMRSIEKRLTAVERRRRGTTTSDGDGTGGWLVGEIKMWPGPNATIPDGWLMCSGTELSRTDYADLYALIGTQYGSGDGSTTFNLPDMRNRVPVGVGSNALFTSLGATGGATSVTLDTTEIPSHSHSGTVASGGAHTHSASSGTAGGHTHYIYGETDGLQYRILAQVAADTSVSARAVIRNTGSGNNLITDNPGGHTHTVTVASDGAHTHTFTGGSTGGGGAHDNVQPYITTYFIIYTGVTA